MKWSDLSKEHKQYAVLGAIVGVALIYVLFTVISSLMAKDTDGEGNASVDLEMLEKDVAKAERSIKRERRLITEYETCYAELLARAEQYFPNEDNRYSWVTELIYTQSRKLDIDVEQISELGRKEPTEQQLFERYAVQVSLRCSYEKLIRFVGYFEDANPLMRIISLSVSSNSQDPNNHNVSLIMEWPTAMDVKIVEEK